MRFGEDKNIPEMSTETGQGVNDVLEKLVDLLESRSQDVVD